MHEKKTRNAQKVKYVLKWFAGWEKRCNFAIMVMKTLRSSLLKVVLPIVLGGAILWWMYRDVDFRQLWRLVEQEMSWTWMLLSMPFGLLAQLLRGWRWRQTLDPLGEHPRRSTCVHAVLLSYAASLVIPRIGEFMRCGVLKRYDGTSFSKALGTVVTERAVDTLLVGGVTGLTLLWQMSMFGTFFEKTGTTMDSLLGRFTTTGWWVTAICAVAVLLLLVLLLRRLSVYDKVKTTLGGLWQGVLSLKDVRNKPLFVFFTLGIWVSYFLHYYLTFFCFSFTSGLGLSCALVTFIVGSIAVIVPTPNGAGPWHFAVKTMLILYGVQDEQALCFVLVVHTLQTLLVALLGIYAWMALGFQRGRGTEEQRELS